MKNNLVYHLTEHTFISEFHTHLCDHNTVSSPNFHKNLELIVAKKGGCNVFVADKSYRIEEGQAAFIIPYQIHWFEVDHDGLVSCTTFHESLVITLYRAINENHPTTPVFTPTKATYDYFLGQMYLLFGSNSGIREKLAPAHLRLKVKALLYALESEFLEQVPLERVDDVENITTLVLKYISENFKENISLKDIAVSSGYNYQYLSRAFNNMFGMNFKKLLNIYRAEHAFHQLQDTDKSIIDIALESGFQSIRSFYRVSLDIFGCSPKELRRRERKI